MYENQIIEKVNAIASSWDNFKFEYKNMQNQVDQIQTSLNRPNFGHHQSDAEKSIMLNYLRKGDLPHENKSYYNSANDSAGSMIMPAFSNKIVSGIEQVSPIRKLFSIESISSNELDIIVEDGEFETGWVLEVEKRMETKISKLKQRKIMVHELYAQPMATQRLIDDASIDVENWLCNRLIDSFARIENKAFISGDGKNKPKGILTDEEIITLKAKQEGKVAIEDIMSMINSLGQYHLTNASFIMHRSTLSYIQTLKDESGRFIWQPSYSHMQPQTLFGIPLYCCDDMPPIAKGQKIIALGDFKKGYRIVDRQGVAIMRDHYTHKPFVKFYATKRVGGDVVSSAAIKLLEC